METVRKIRCSCKCHNEKEGVKIMHFVPCCNNGWIEILIKDYWGDLEKDTYPLDYKEDGNIKC